MDSMFRRTAAFYDSIYAAEGKDYAHEADALVAHVRARRPQAATLLDVACGSGAHLARFAGHGFVCRGLDKDLPMVEIAKSRLAEVQIDPGDMLDFRLPERYDVITCLFGSIAYMRTNDLLCRAIANMAAHLTPAGLLLVEPFVRPEEYAAGSLHAVLVDEPELKIARVSLGRRILDVAQIEFHYLIATRDGVERFVEHQELALFSEEDYRAAFADAGLRFESLNEPAIARDRGLYLGTR
jgi:N-dimethyltransferase